MFDDEGSDISHLVEYFRGIQESAKGRKPKGDSSSDSLKESKMSVKSSSRSEGSKKE